MWNHFVLRTANNIKRFQDDRFAWWSWNWVKKNSESALSLMLMPNHVHFISAERAQSEIMHRLRFSLNREFSLNARDWDEIPMPEDITDRWKLARNIRYVHLNPCRKGLVRDPLLWKWSTHRDWLGYASESIISREHAQEFKTWSREKFHSYVSSDPCVNVQGTLLPSSTSLTAAIDLSVLKKKLEHFTRTPFNELLQKRNPQRIKMIPLVAQSLRLKTNEIADFFHLTQRQIQKLSHTHINEPRLQHFKEFITDMRL